VKKNGKGGGNAQGEGEGGIAETSENLLKSGLRQKSISAVWGPRHKREKGQEGPKAISKARERGGFRLSIHDTRCTNGSTIHSIAPEGDAEPSDLGGGPRGGGRGQWCVKREACARKKTIKDAVSPRAASCCGDGGAPVQSAECRQK